MPKKHSQKTPQSKPNENNDHSRKSNKLEWVKTWLPILLGVWGTVLSTYLAIDKIQTSRPRVYVQSSVVVDGISNDGKAVGHVDAYLTNIGEANVAIETQAEILATNAHDGDTTRITLLCAQIDTEQSRTSDQVLGKPPVLKPSETAVCKSEANLILGNIANPTLNYLSIHFRVFNGKPYYAFITIPQFLSPPIEGIEGRSWMGGAVAVSP